MLQDKDSSRKSKQVDGVEGQWQYEVVLDQLLAGDTYTITLTAIREIDMDAEESQPRVESGTTGRFSIKPFHASVVILFTQWQYFCYILSAPVYLSVNTCASHTVCVCACVCVCVCVSE